MRALSSTFAGADGLALHVRSWHPDVPTRAALAVVHGFGDHSGRYGPLVEALVPAGVAVHAVDLRGHGQSPGPRGHIDAWRQYREDVAGFLAFVHGASEGAPLFLFGHSLGGAIVLELCLRQGSDLQARNGLRGVVASAPALDPIGARRPVLELLSRGLSRVWPRFAVDLHLDRSALSRRLETAEVYAEDPLVHGRVSARTAQETIGALIWIRANAGGWRLPLLVTQGSADRLTAPEASRAFVLAARAGGASDVELRIYEGGYHEPHNDVEAEEAMADLRRWLFAHLPRAGGA